MEIIKRIKKINEDGSYTIGYEADDGSFKIESRDVLGHIKGTYGFVDEDGQVKRVSYTTNNSTEIINKPDPPSVVQRIPAKKPIPTTYIFTSTQSTPITSTLLSKRKPTTQKPNYQNIVNIARTTLKPKYVTYSSAAPKVLLQGKPSAAFNGQISRPDLTELPSPKKSVNTANVKPVTEDAEPEIRGNILRRELSHRPEYDIKEHVFNLQQSLGHDSVDVYSSSMTTGTPRPLFTTTARSRPIFSTVPTFSTSSTSPAPRTIPPYPVNYLKNSLQDIESSSNNYAQQETTTPPPNSTPPVSVSQIPSSRPEIQEPLVAIRHPHQRNTILVPLSQLQGRIVPIEQYREINEESRQYSYEKQPMAVEIEQQSAVVRRLPQHPLRPMPVQVDENGYIREVPRHVPTPYPIPVPANQLPRYVNVENDIDSIQPPVSTKDFQRLLQQLIIRQSRLEKISALTKQSPETFMQPEPPSRYRQAYSQPLPYFYQRERIPADHPAYGPKQDQRQNYIQVEQQQLVPIRNQQRPSIYEDYDSQSYRPNRRVARLLPSGPAHQETDDYLPSDVREMLLLRMLQLAINPALPIDEDEVEIVSKSMPVKRTPVRNVEILGEDGSSEEIKMQKKQVNY